MDFFEEYKMEIVTESSFFDKEDLIIGWDQWRPERGRNIAYITGLSGSGKSTISQQIGAKNTIVIHLDAIERCEVTYRTESIIKKLKAKFKWYNENWYNSDDRYDDDMHHIILEIVDICEKNPNQLYIIEGVQLFESLIPEFFIGKPVLIKGTSILNSILRRFKRNGNGKIDWIPELKNEFVQLVGWYLCQEKDLNRLRKKINRV